MSSSHSHKSVGRSPSKLDYGIEQDPLDWRRVRGMHSRDRDSEIIKRANLYNFYWGIWEIDSGELLDAMEKAKEENKYSKDREIVAAPRVERLILEFPLRDNSIREFMASSRRKRNNVAELASEFQKVIDDFQKTELCHQVKTVARKLLQSREVNKIVAFGLSFLNGLGAGHPITIRLQTQHAALLAIRDVWKEKHKGSFEIYLQDPQYIGIDVELAQKFGMTVVNGDIGHQMGYVLVDADTLVVDLISIWTVAPLIFEIARPAGLLTAWPILLDAIESEVIFRYTFTRHNEDGSQKEDLIFPGLGVDARTAVTKALEEYTENNLDLSKCDLGKTEAEILTHEPPPPTPPMESTPAGPSKPPSKLKAGMNRVKKAAKQLSPPKSKLHSASQAGPSQAGLHSASQAGPSQAGPHSSSQVGPSHPTPHPTSQSGPSRPNYSLALGKDGEYGRSHMGYQPTLYIRKW